MNRQASLLSSLRALPRPAWILFIGTFLNKFGTFVVPFLTLYLISRGYTVGQAGVAVAAYGVGNLAAAILGGYLTDKVGRRRTIMLSTFLGAAMMLLLSQARGFPIIILLTALTGLANEFYRPASNALLADLVPAGQRITAFATLRMAFNAGFAFGPATAGFLAAYGFLWLFVGNATASVLFGLVALLALPRDVCGPAGNASWGEAWHVLRHDRKLHQMLAANFAIGLVFVQMVSTFGLLVIHLGFPPADYGLLISLNGALVVFCELPLTTFTRRFPSRRVIAIGYLIVASGYVLNFFAHTIPMLTVCMVIYTLGEMVTMPMASAYVADLAPASLRGRYLGVSGLTWSLAFVVGPAGGMRLFAFSPAVYFAVTGALGLLAAGIISASVKSAPPKNLVVAGAGT